MQEVGVFILFSGALGFLGWELFKSLKPQKDSCSGCSACAGVDFDALGKKIEKDLRSR